jgi:hypothetical protein
MKYQDHQPQLTDARTWPPDYQSKFWAAYPRRVAKKAAMTALERVRRSGEVTFTALLAAVERYAASVAMKDIQFVAHATTWINQGRWEDDPEHLESTYYGTRKISSAEGWASRRRDRLEGQEGGDRPRLLAAKPRSGG